MSLTSMDDIISDRTMNKFMEEFEKQTNQKFRLLKLKNVEFYRETQLLRINFNVSTFEIKTLSQNDIDEIQAACDRIFPNIRVRIGFVRTFADEKIVKGKIVEYFNNKQPMLLAMLKDDSIAVEIKDNFITVSLNLETAAYRLFKISRLDEMLFKHLDKEFNEEIEVLFNEIPVQVELETVDETRTKYIPTNVVFVEDAQLIYVKMGERVFASREKSNQINMLPSYISNVKDPCENIVLCGKIIDFTEREYRNKKYSEDDKGQPEFKTMFKWRLFDKTGIIECVTFPDPKNVDLLRKLANSDEIVCQGKITENNYQGSSLNFLVSTIYKAEEIDYNSIKGSASKPEPEFYEYIHPKDYENNALTQTSFLNSQKVDETVPSMLAGKSFVVFDLETTGLDTSTARIIEISGVKIENGKITKTFTSLINPKMSIPSKITQVTSLTDNDVIDAPTSELVMPDFYKFTRGCALVAHNISYDFPILSRHSEPLGYIYENDLFDTLGLARQHFPHLKKYNLEFLSQHFSIMHDNAHRAMSDALATAELFMLIAKEIDKKSNNMLTAG